MEAMLTALQTAVETAIPLILVALGAVGAVKVLIPLAVKAYRVVVGFIGSGAR